MSVSVSLVLIIYQNDCTKIPVRDHIYFSALASHESRWLLCVPFLRMFTIPTHTHTHFLLSLGQRGKIYPFHSIVLYAVFVLKSHYDRFIFIYCRYVHVYDSILWGKLYAFMVCMLAEWRWLQQRWWRRRPTDRRQRHSQRHCRCRTSSYSAMGFCWSAMENFPLNATKWKSRQGC